MPDIHFMRPDGTKEVFPEERIGELREQGTLYSFTYFWKEGMPEWLPVAELTGGYRPFAEKLDFKRDVKRLSKFVKSMMGLLVIIVLYNSFFAVVMNVYGANDFSEIISAGAILINMVEFFLIIFLTADSMRFIYAANTNVRWFGAEDMRFSPAWAVGCFFVPVANIVLPYMAVSEISKASENPEEWKEVATDKNISTWWGALICGFLFGLLWMFIMEGDMFSHGEARKAVSVLLLLIRAVFNISFCILSVKIVNKITVLQTAWVENKRRDAAAGG